MDGAADDRLSAIQMTDWTRPGRLLAAATFSGAVGLGAVTPLTVLFFVRFVGLPARAVGLGMSVASVLALACVVPAGRLADRYGPRRVSILLSVAAAGVLGTYVLVRYFAAFLVVQCLLTMLFASGRVSENALIAGVLPREQRTRFKARQRSVYNIGFALGTLLAAIPLQVDRRGAYVAVILADVAVTALGAGLVAALPRVAPLPVEPGRNGLGAIRDRPYAVVALLCGLTAVQTSLLTVALPLWVTTRTEAPRPLVSVLLLLNTVMVVVLQVWAARGADTAGTARIVNLRGALAFLVACPIVGLAAGVRPWLAVALLVTGIAVFTMGEMWMAAAGWTLGFELADERAHGQYQGVFALGTGIGRMVGPVLATNLVLPAGVLGWGSAGAFFAVLGLCTVPAVDWAIRERAGRSDRAPA